MIRAWIIPPIVIPILIALALAALVAHFACGYRILLGANLRTTNRSMTPEPFPRPCSPMPNDRRRFPAWYMGCSAVAISRIWTKGSPPSDSQKEHFVTTIFSP